MVLCACYFVLFCFSTFSPPLAARGLFWESLATLDKCPLTSSFLPPLAVGDLPPFPFPLRWIWDRFFFFFGTIFKGRLNNISFLYQLRKHPNHSRRCSEVRAVEGYADPDRSCMKGALGIRAFPLSSIHETLKRFCAFCGISWILKVGKKGWSFFW